MKAESPPDGQAALATLLGLARQARHAGSPVELGFLAVNDSHALVHYRQAALWLTEGATIALSGVVQLEANAPYAQWLDQVCRTLPIDSPVPHPLSAAMLPAPLAADWNEWLPAHGLWLPLSTESGGAAPHPDPGCTTGGLLLARETAWQAQELALLAEWVDIWRHAWDAMSRPAPWSWRGGLASLRRPAGKKGRGWKRRLVWGLAVVAVFLFPVRLTVLVPGELVPANPAVIRAPQDGVVGGFFVKPNAIVTPGQALFNLDSTALTSRLEVAQQALASAEAEYRQSAQLAVSDGKYKGQLAMLTGKVEERRADVDYLRGQLERSHVVAPQAGMALFDDPSEWIGKPVTTGERIMRVATPDEVEIEAWLPVGDAIRMENGAAVTLYLNASPLSPVGAQISYFAHDALQRPDGNYAYRIRATLKEGTSHRIGLKGTAKLTGDRVPLCYWVLRKPLAAARQLIGF